MPEKTCKNYEPWTMLHVAFQILYADRRYQVMVKAQRQEMTFSVVENAAKALTQLKPGDKVTVSYTEAGGKLTAQSVTKS